MGARNLNRVQFTLERDVVRLFGRGTGAGAADCTAVKGAGVSTAATAIKLTKANLGKLSPEVANEIASSLTKTGADLGAEYARVMQITNPAVRRAALSALASGAVGVTAGQP